MPTENTKKEHKINLDTDYRFSIFNFIQTCPMGTSLHTANDISARPPLAVRGAAVSLVSILLLIVNLLLLGLIN